MFFPFAAKEIAVIALISNHLLHAIRDINTHGRQPLKGIIVSIWIVFGKDLLFYEKNR